MMVGLCIVTEKYIYVCKKKNDAETAQSQHSPSRCPCASAVEND